ncbi:MAG: hypothetical protein GX575_30475 [Candidatus Anammoximicrobium sp.]|nr:hypothetical protein [Candidatus Anammoximicrobium sp.]
MDRPDELEQQLWEFVYDLLPADEAATVRRRIAAEPDVAQVYDGVRRQACLLAEAARFELPPITLPRPGADDSASTRDAPRPASTAAGPAARFPRGWVNWTVGLAASGLLCYLGWAAFHTGWPGRSVVRGTSAATLANEPVRAVLIGPQELQPVLTNYVAVQTQNAAGEPVAATVDYRWYSDDGAAVDSGHCQTDASGFTQLALARPLRSQAVHLEVEPQTAWKNVSLRCSIPVASSELTTYLTTDKTIYRPGEQVRFRTVTLDRADLQVHREVPVALRVVNEDGQEVRGVGTQVTTRNGVGFGDFELPQHQPPGKQTLIAASPAGDFPEARREFEVRPYRTPTLRQTLDFARDSYAPGEEVEADLRVELADGKPAANVPLAVTAESGTRKFFNLHTTTNDQGLYRVRFKLPAKADPGQAVLNVTTGKEVQERISELIPIHHGRVTVEFFPESGELVPDATNRVYFFAHDGLDRPVHVQGRVVDRQGRRAAEVQTIRDGRGVFVLRPASDEHYRLLIDQPSGAAEQPELPPASARQFVALDAGTGVFVAGMPIKVQLVSREDRPVAVVAVCRGVVVGQELVSPAVFQNEFDTGGPEVVVPVAPTAEGLIRLTVYDYSAQPPTPVAERLVYRRPARRLSLRPSRLHAKYSPGDAVNLAISVGDERRQPQSAVLGAAVVDEAALSLVRDRSASLTTHFWLTGQIDDVRGLEDANFYLRDGSEAEQALDLLLGTQGWRRFTTAPSGPLAQMAVVGQTDREPFASQVPAGVGAGSEPTAPTVLADNAQEVSRIVSSGLALLETASAQTVRRVSGVLIVGSLILAIMLGLLAAMRHLPATTVWLPALGTSAMCLVLGCVSLVTQGQPAPELAQVALDESVAERQVAQAGKRLATASMPESALSSATAKPEEKESLESLDLVVKAKGVDRKQAAQGAVAGRVMPAADKGAAPADESALPRLAEKANKLQDSDTDRYGMRLEQRQSLRREARPHAEAMKRRLVPENEAPRQDAAIPQEPPAERKSSQAGAAPAPPPAAAARTTSREAAIRAAVPEKAEKMAGQFGSGRTTEKAGGMMPGIEAQSTPGAMPGMDMGGGAFGAPVAPDAARDRQGQLRAAGRGDAAGGGAMYGGVALPSAGAAPSGPAREPAPSIGEKREADRALSESADQPTRPPARPGEPPPARGAAPALADSLEPSQPQLYREYARRSLAAVSSDGRSPHAETLLWEPLLETDAQGRATLEFTLPDAATTYRVLVDGHAAGRIGSYLGRIIVQPDAPAAPK